MIQFFNNHPMLLLFILALWTAFCLVLGFGLGMFAWSKILKDAPSSPTHLDSFDDWSRPPVAKIHKISKP